MQNQNSSKPSAGGNATKKKGRNKPEELLVITKAKDLVKHKLAWPCPARQLISLNKQNGQALR